MTSYDTAISAGNAAILAAMGEPVTVTVRGVALALTAVVTRSPQTAEFGGLGVQQTITVARFDAADLETAEAWEGDRVTIAGREYVIAAPPEPDDGGMSFVSLRAL